MDKIQNDHVSASWGDRKPPFANWHYNSVVYISGDGHESHTASHASTLRSVAGADELGKKKIGKTVGFGKYIDEVVTDYRVVVADYERHPEEIEIAVKQDAEGLLRSELAKRMRGNPQAVYTAEERKSMDWLKENAGREFEVMRDEDVPQMTPKQFWNTMPCEEAPGGYCLPRGLCYIVARKKPEIPQVAPSILVGILGVGGSHMMPQEMLPMMDCDHCLFRQESWRDGGHCYMFREKPEGDRCGQFKNEHS